MNKYFIQLFLMENTVILPGFGALALLNDKLSEIVFLPDLKTDDGKLASYISEIEGIEEQDAKNTIAKFIREIESNLNQGDSFDIFEFGSFTKTENGQIEFTSWMKDKIVEGSALDSREENILVSEKENFTIEGGIIATESKDNIESEDQEKSNLVGPLPIAEDREIPTEKMDSLALIRALLNEDPEESTNPKINLGEEKKNDNYQEKFVPVVNTTVLPKEKSKQKRKFPFLFFFLLLGFIISVFLTWYNFGRIKNKIQILSSDNSLKKDIYYSDSLSVMADTNQSIGKESDLKKKANSDGKENLEPANKVNPQKSIQSRKKKTLEPADKGTSSKESNSVLSRSKSEKENNKMNIRPTEEIIVVEFHIISGVYGPKRYAQKRMETYLEEGYNAQIISKKIGGLFYVSIETFTKRPPAIKFLRTQRTKGKRVWMMKV